ncbi:hypothetical protein AGDE_13347 [Angomonas deanei]|uniref:Uncharacterized protein n=1 Tax=Angomonas deanei TaxID=59799 RepID=A0A7G2CFG8_9TRYP|nr:hypothetical protein AGDE_13347 [Angomonas deanei]CAD2218279.1 hypothetical protein, conserved [Angomonas deanei]|eukprot:EPY22460.1 hypothetical protein AGDE_13347 [Angomonas deanei]
MSYFGFLFLFLHITFVTGGTPSYVHQLTESVLPPLWTVPGIPYTTVKPSSGASPVCVFTSPSDVPLPYTFNDFGDDFGVVYGRFTDTDSFSRFGQLDVVANCYINTDKACVGKFYSTAEDCAQGALESLSLNATADLHAGPSSFVFLAFISQHLGNRGFLRSALASATDILMEIGFMKSELLTGLPKLTLEDEKEGLQRAVAQNFKHYLETEYFTVLDQKWDLLIEYVDTALRPGAGDYTPDQCTITGLLEVIRERKAPPPATEVFASVLDTVRDFVQMPLDENTLSEAYLTQTLAPQTYCAVLSFVVTSLWSMDRDILLLQSFSTSDAKLLEVIESVDQTVVADRLSDLETRIQSEFSSVVADPSTAPSVVFKKCVYSFFTSASALTEVSPTKCLRRLYVSAKDVEWDFSSGGTLVTQSDDIERYFFDFDEVNFSLLQTAGSTLEQQEQIYYPKVDPCLPFQADGNYCSAGRT